MEKKVLATIAAALMSSAGFLHPDPVCAEGAASAYDDSTVDASLDPGEERISADGENQARLKDLRYAYFIGYNARAREDSKSYATLGDEVKHAPKPLAEQATSTPVVAAPLKPVTEHAVAQKRTAPLAAAPLRQTPVPVAPPRRLAAQHAAPSRQAIAQAVPVPLKRVPVQVMPARQVSAQMVSVPPKHVAAPVASVRQASVQVAPSKHGDQPAGSFKQVSVREVSVHVLPPKQIAAQAAQPKPISLPGEPPILIPTQAVTSLPDDKPDSDDTPATQARDPQGGQRVQSQYRQADDDRQYESAQAAQNPPRQQYQNPQAQQYAATPAYRRTPAASQDPEYAPPPRSAPVTQYAPPPPPAQYQPAYAQSGYVPRPPSQATAQQVTVVARPPAYSTYDQTYTPPEFRRPYPQGYGNSAQPPGYQGWE
ncbi:hypothetical protein [Paraburkholderia sp. BCC1885]|uniref:hypothetical protein n=1 Tax=Paraburkholderia sp. BCC1885 TaxID=2562669 RepID=UPI00118340C5|nr:hypothetical protein [Paraburkholderia sp. BCC1885]